MESPQPAQVPPRPISPASSQSDASDKSSLAETPPQHAATEENQPLLSQQQPKDAKVDDAQISPEGSSIPTSDVRYVLSGQPTGWAAMAETVRTYDEEKVKDTKEDIDTLLVFAGLFSAVLTAFLIESYQSLSPDTSSQMLLVMQQIALQTASYNMVNGMINATSQPPMNITDVSSQPFQPSVAAIRVNVLWFSSLIFSLITASFGMLVKQWLREFLAVENPSPQARLRIRRFRYPELMQWNVFEIAAILPLLQQIALALFFIGLCYFTESVHESVGHTSLPLVAGWAFCFSIFTILPIFFPRCPYKTTLLKHVLQSIHMRSVKALQRITRQIAIWHSTADYESIRDRALRWATALLMFLDLHARKSDEQGAVIAERADLDILVDVDALQSNDELLGSTILESLHQIQPDWDNVVDFVRRVLQHRLQRRYVADAAPGPLDLQTLSRPGRTAIIDILSHYSSSAISQYLQSDQAIARWQRSKETMTAFYIFFSPSRYPLPKTGINVLSEVLQYKGVPLLRLLAHECPRPAEISDDTFYLLVQGVHNTLEDLDVNLTLSLRYFETLMDVRFENTRHPEGSFAVQRDLEGWPWHSVMSQDGRLYSARFLIWTVYRVLRQMQKPASSSPSRALVQSKAPAAVALQPPPSRLVDALVGMWQMAYIAKIGEFSHTQELKFRSVVEECLAMKESTLALLKTLGLVTTRIIIETQTKWFAGPFGPWLLLEDAQQKLTNLIDAVHELRLASRQLEYQHSKSSPITTVHVLLICYIALHMIEPSAALQYADQWRNLFDVLTDLGNESIGITSTNRNSGVAAATAEPSPSPVPYTIQPAQFIGVGFEESQQVVERCLKMVQRHDTHVLSRRPDIPFSQSMSAPELRSAYDDWLTLFTDEDSIIQDSFVKMLARIYNPPGLLVHHDGPKFQFFRLEKLGLARGSENDSDNGSSHTVMGFHML